MAHDNSAHNDQLPSEDDTDLSLAEGVDDETESEPLSKKRYQIDSYGADYTVDTLVKRMNQGAFIVPPFQRKFVWSRTHASRFIESLLLGLPVPGIFLYKRTEDSKHLVIDGQQRLKSLQAYYNGLFGESKFRLTGVREPWNGLAYDELDADDQLRLDDSIIHTIIFSQKSPKDDVDSIHFVFERVNSGGIRLSPQEIRNCITSGKFTDLTVALNKDPSWRHIYGPESGRAKDQELIIRVLALSEDGDKYERPMATFLTKFSEKMNKSSDKDLDRLAKIFKRTVQLSWDALGQSAFRPVRTLNAAVLDGFMAALARHLAAGEDLSVDQVRSAYNSLMKDARFREGWERATSDEESVQKRLEVASQAIDAS
ncbi:DUF262 domain-containing protein [Amaricoccus solimangrovi]|nr:DUF262 domain-containing protein [Amaricoccus solimangrovi]